MKREQLEELASLDALGLLEESERRVLIHSLREDPSVRQMVESFSQTAASLAFSIDQIAPPPALKARVLSALPDRVPAQPARTQVPGKRESSNWIPWALAASFALASGLLLLGNLGLRREVAQLERQGALDSLRISVLSSMLQGSPEARAVCVWDADRQMGLLNVEKLPPVPEGKDYQLWVIDPKYPIPVDGGVFNTASDGSIRYRFNPGLPVERADVFAVSLERKGGVPKAEGPMVLVSR